MARKVYLNDEEVANIQKDIGRGLSQREVGRKYDLSTTKVREALGLNLPRKKKLKSDEKIELKNKILKKRDKKTKETIEAIEVQQFSHIIKGEYLDVFEGIRQSAQDMIDLNNEQKDALDNMIASLTEVRDKFDRIADIETDADLRKALYKLVSEVSSYYGRGKLRIDSRKELGSWIDRYKDFNMISQQFSYYEKIINAFFEGINLLNEHDYEKVRNAAVGVFNHCERYFDKNEKQATEVQPDDNH